jgi:hypothetical protein
MAALGWIINLGFGGGGVGPQINVIRLVDVALAVSLLSGEGIAIPEATTETIAVSALDAESVTLIGSLTDSITFGTMADETLLRCEQWP